tara:strand:+ start:878 stop:1066 length:189 start_codon:yes stop_codon:yes gene_type:complete
MRIGIDIFEEIKKQVRENNMSEEFVELVIERIDNDSYLWEQIQEAIKYAIEAESDYAKSIKE